MSWVHPPGCVVADDWSICCGAARGSDQPRPEATTLPMHQAKTPPSPAISIFSRPARVLAVRATTDLTKPTANSPAAVREPAHQSPTVVSLVNTKGRTEVTEPARKSRPDTVMAVKGERRSESTTPNSSTFIAFSMPSSERSKTATISVTSSSVRPIAANMLPSWSSSCLAVVTNVVPLEFDLRREHIILRLGRQVLPGRHGDGACDRACHGCQQDLVGVEAAADHTRDEQQHRHQPIVDAQDDVPPVRTAVADVALIRGDGPFALRLGPDRLLVHWDGGQPFDSLRYHRHASGGSLGRPIVRAAREKHTGALNRARCRWSLASSREKPYNETHSHYSSPARCWKPIDRSPRSCGGGRVGTPELWGLLRRRPARRQSDRNSVRQRRLPVTRPVHMLIRAR